MTTDRTIGFVDAPVDRARNADLERMDWLYQRALQTGMPAELFEFYASLASRESTLEAAIGLRRAGVSSAQMSVLPGADSDAGRQNAERVKTILSALPMAKVMDLAAEAVPMYGIDASEIVWERDGGEFRPADLIFVEPQAMGWVTQNGFLGQFRNLAPGTWLIRTGPITYEPLQQNGWLVIPRKHRGSPANFSLMRSSGILALFLIMAEKSWVSFVDRYGIPLVEIVLQGKGDDALDKMAEDILANWSRRGGWKSTTDDGLAVKIHDGAGLRAMGSSDIQERLLKWLDSSIGRQWNGGALVQGTGTGAGSYSLGNVHASSQASIYQADASRIATAITNCIVKPYMMANGIPGPIPTVEILTRVEIANRISTLGWLAQNGYVVSDTTQLSSWMQIEMKREEPRGTTSN